MSHSSREGSDFGTGTDPQLHQLGVRPDLEIRLRKGAELFIDDMPYNYCRVGNVLEVKHLRWGNLRIDAKTLKVLD